MLWSEWLYRREHPTPTPSPTPEPTPSPTKVPKTGDPFSPELPLAMIAAGLLGLLALVILRISAQKRDTHGRL